MSQTKSNQCVVARDIESPGITSAQCIPASNAYTLRPDYVETPKLEAFLKTSPSNLLGIVRHDRNSYEPGDIGSCPVVHLDMAQLTGHSLAEVWTSGLSVTYHQAKGFQCAMNDEVLFGALQLEERPGTLLDTVTYDAYRRLLVQVRALGYPHLLRIWNYFPHINREFNGLERYKRFCAGRHQALAEGLSDFPRTLPAATAIGTMSGPLKIHFLAARRSGTHVENPRQVSAYDYPRVYSPRSPSFARATLCTSALESHLFISGTASVVGHVSEHAGAPHGQTMEIIRNLNALIAQTELRHGLTRGQWFGQALLKIYIRHPEHFVTIRDILKDQLPSHIQVLYLQGAMCRSELLLEVEGVLGHEQTMNASQALSSAPVRPQQSASQHTQADSFNV